MYIDRWVVDKVDNNCMYVVGLKIQNHFRDKYTSNIEYIAKIL